MDETTSNIPQETGDEIEETDEREDGTSSISHESSGKSLKKKKRHSKVKSRQNSVSGALEGLEEDILEAGQTITITANEYNPNITLKHGASEKLFVQNKKGFEPASRDRVFQGSFHDLSQSQEVDSEKYDLSPHEFAINLYHKTRLFFSFCHGILGGFGVAHMSLVLSIADSPEAVQSFAEGYPDFARVVQILYYILSAICFVSVLDRCDFAGLQFTHCIDFLRYRMADILTIIFYLGLLVATVVCIPWDDRLALSSSNEDLWKDPDGSHSQFMQWRILSLVRGSFALAGYVTMFFGPGDDLFFIHLYNMVNREKREEKHHKTRY